MDVTKPYKFIGFGAMDVTKPYKFIGFGATYGSKPYKFIGFGAIYGSKPYKFIGFGAMEVTKPYPDLFDLPDSRLKAFARLIDARAEGYDLDLAKTTPQAGVYPLLGTDIFDSGPKPVQNRPKTGQNRFQTGPNRPKTIQDHPKTVQHRQKPKSPKPRARRCAEPTEPTGPWMSPTLIDKYGLGPSMVPNLINS
jgi:hypothetical protein